GRATPLFAYLYSATPTPTMKTAKSAKAIRAPSLCRLISVTRYSALEVVCVTEPVVGGSVLSCVSAAASAMLPAVVMLGGCEVDERDVSAFAVASTSLLTARKSDSSSLTVW